MFGIRLSFVEKFSLDLKPCENNNMVCVPFTFTYSCFCRLISFLVFGSNNLQNCLTIQTVVNLKRIQHPGWGWGEGGSLSISYVPNLLHYYGVLEIVTEN